MTDQQPEQRAHADEPGARGDDLGAQDHETPKSGPGQHGQTSNTSSNPEADSKGEKNEKETAPKTFIAKLSENIKAVSAALTHLILIAILSVCVLVIARELRVTGAVFDQIEIPEPLQKRGRTAVAISQSLLDEIRRFQRESGESSTRRRLLEPAWTRERDDLQVPGGNVSVRAVVQFFKKQLGLSDVRIGGTLSQDTKHRLTLTLRTTDEGVIPTSDPVDFAEIDRLFEPAARDILKKTDPYLLASYSFVKELKSGQFEETLKWIKYSLANEYETTAARVYNLWGNIHANRGDLDLALEYYEKSTLEAKPFAEVFVNWGDALMLKGEYASALPKYERAQTLDSSLASARAGSGYAQAGVVNYREAESHFRAAIEKDHKLVWPYVGLADAYNNQGDRKRMLEILSAAGKLAERQLLELEARDTLAEEDFGLADLYVTWGTALLISSNVGLAYEKFSKAAEINPRLPDAPVGLGNASVWLGLYDEAISHYERAIKIHPYFWSAFSGIGDALAAKGDFDAAIAWYRKALVVNPFSIEVRVSLAGSFFNRGDLEDGNKEFEQALDIASGKEVIQTRWGNALSAVALSNSAVDKFRAAVRANPDFAPAFLGWAETLNARGSLAAAIERYRRTLELVPTSADAYNGWGKALAKLQRPHQAIELYQKAIAEVPDNSSVYSNWGDALNALGAFPAALDKYRKAIATNPRTEDAYLGWGSALLAMGEVEQAKTKYVKTADVFPGFPSSYVRLGDLHFRRDEFKLGFEHYSRERELGLMGYLVSLSCASAVVGRGRFDAADSLFDWVIRLRPSFVWAYANYGDLQFDRGDTQSGNTLYQRALELAPDSEELYYRWGSALLSAMKYPEAIDKFKMAIEINPAYAPAHRGWGDALMGENDHDAARHRCQAAVERNPRYFDAYHCVASALANLGRDREAFAKYREAIDANPDNLLWAYIRLGALRFARKDLNGGNSSFAHAESINRFDYNVYNEWGLALAQARLFGDAARKYEKAMDLDPGIPAIYDNWGMALMNDGDSRAIEKFERAVQLHPNLPYTYLRLGDASRTREQADKYYDDARRANQRFSWIHVRWGSWDYEADQAAGESAFRRAARLQPYASGIFDEWGKALLQKGDIPAANWKFRCAVAINPRDSEAWKLWGDGLAALGYRQASREKYRRARDIDPDIGIGQVQVQERSATEAAVAKRPAFVRAGCL